MKVVVAIDSLKGSLTSLEAGEAIREGVLRAIPEAEVVVRPLADGGEGTVEALTLGMGGRMETATVTGPLGRPVACAYGLLPEERLAVVEMSGAAGITQVPEAERDPMNTTTYGVGEVIRRAIEQGCRRFIIGLGGSATNDGGIGMLQALGFGMLNDNGAQVSFGAKGLQELRTITTEHVLPELAECEFRVACDVTNPLCGERGKRQRRPGAQIRRGHIRPRETRDPENRRATVCDVDLRPRLSQFGNVAEARRENGIGDRALPITQAREGGRLRLQVGRKTGIGRGLDPDRAQSPRTRDGQRTDARPDLRAHPYIERKKRRQMRRLDRAERNRAAGRQSERQIRPRLDHIGADAIGNSV